MNPIAACLSLLLAGCAAMPEAGTSIPDGSEFALVMIRRTDEGEVVMLGEVPDDVTLVERAARRLVG